MAVLYLPPNASVLADQKEVLTGWPSSPGPPPLCEKAVPPSTFWASSSQEVLVPRTHAQVAAPISHSLSTCVDGINAPVDGTPRLGHRPRQEPMPQRAESPGPVQHLRDQ